MAYVPPKVPSTHPSADKGEAWESIKVSTDSLNGLIVVAGAAADAEATARASGDADGLAAVATEATARAAADTTERQLRQAADATNAAAAAAADSKAVSARAAADAVAVRAAALEAWREREIGDPRSYPGRAPEHFVAVRIATGARQDIPAAWLDVSPDGPALRVPGGWRVEAREPVPALPGATVRAIAAFGRASPTSDLSGHAIAFAVYPCDAYGAAIYPLDPLRIEVEGDLAPADGLVRAVSPDLVVGATLTVADGIVTIPVGTRGYRPAIVCYGDDADTWVVQLGAAEVTLYDTRPVVSPSLAEAQAAIVEHEDRLTTLETAIDAPSRRAFRTLAEFLAASLATLTGVTSVGLLGWTAEADGGAVWLQRDVDGDVLHPTGSAWRRVLAPIMRGESWGAVPDGEDPQVTQIQAAIDDVAGTGNQGGLSPGGYVLDAALVMRSHLRWLCAGSSLVTLIRDAAYGGASSAESGLYQLIKSDGVITDSVIGGFAIDTDPAIITDDVVDDGVGYGHAINLSALRCTFEDILTRAVRGFQWLGQFEQCLFRRLRQENPQSGGRSGFRPTLMVDSHVVDSVIDSWDDVVFGASAAQSVLLSDGTTATVSTRSSFRNGTNRSRAGRAGGFAFGGPRELVYSSLSTWNGKPITEDGSALVTLLVDRSANIQVGQDVYIAGIVDADLAGSGLVAADVIGTREVVAVGVEVPEGMKGNRFVTIVIEADAPATATGQWELVPGAFRCSWWAWQLTNTDATIRFHVKGHGLATGRTIKVINFPTTAGITAADVAGPRPITVINANEFTVEADVPATGNYGPDLTETELAFSALQQGKAENLDFVDMRFIAGKRSVQGTGGAGFILHNSSLPEGASGKAINCVLVHGPDNDDPAVPWQYVPAIDIHGTAGPIKYRLGFNSIEEPIGPWIDNSGLGSPLPDATQDPGHIIRIPAIAALGPRHGQAPTLVLTAGGWILEEDMTIPGSRALFASAVVGVSEADVIRLGMDGPLEKLVDYFGGEVTLTVTGVPPGKGAIALSWLKRLRLARLIVSRAAGAMGWYPLRPVAAGSALDGVEEFVIDEIVITDATGCAGLAPDLSVLLGLGGCRIGRVTGIPWPNEGAELTVAELAGFPAQYFRGRRVKCSDGDDGAPCMAESDGTDWLRSALGAAVSAS